MAVILWPTPSRPNGLKPCWTGRLTFHLGQRASALYLGSPPTVSLGSLPIKRFNPVAADRIVLAPHTLIQGNPRSKAWASSVVNYSLKKLKARWSFLSRCQPTPKRAKIGSCLSMTKIQKRTLTVIVLQQQFNYTSSPAATNLTVFTYVEDFF